jgi:[ribosomal protein S5]-alanine N-acetyltransferase
MNDDIVQTERLKLVVQQPEETRAMLAAMTPEQRAEVSPQWIARLDEYPTANPWVHGFMMIHRETGTVVGSAAFKSLPTPDGVVEIAYGVEPEHQGKGYATEAAEGLTQYAFGSGLVRVVQAHTLPTPNASTRVLTKCGFRCLGDVIDPEDGRVWRWERAIG